MLAKALHTKMNLVEKLEETEKNAILNFLGDLREKEENLEQMLTRLFKEDASS